MIDASFRGCLFFVPACILSLLALAAGAYTYREISLEMQLQREHGASWKEYYEANHGSLEEVRGKMVFGVVAMFAAIGVAVAIYRMITPPGAIKARRRRRW